MGTNGTTKQIKASPNAILATVLYGINDIPIIRSGDAIGTRFPLQALEFYREHPHDMRFNLLHDRFGNEVVFVGFTPRASSNVIYLPNGRRTEEFNADMQHVKERLGII